MTDKEQIQELKAHLSVALARISELEALVMKLTIVKTSKNSHSPRRAICLARTKAFVKRAARL